MGIRSRLILSLGLLLAPTVWAEEVAHCNGLAYDGCRSLSSTLTWLADPNDYATPLPGYFYQPNGCAALLPGVPDIYRVCRDTTADGQPDTIEEMTLAEKNAVDAAAASAADASLRSGSKAQFDGQQQTGLGLRCLAKIILDEINLLRQRTNDVKNCVADAGSLALAKACELALPDLSDRTVAQAKTAIGNCVDTGAVDE